MKKIVSLTLTILISTSLFANELTEIATVGATQSVSQNSSVNANLELAKKLQNTEFRKQYIEKQLAEIKSQQYNVHTSQLTLGRVVAHANSYPNLPQALAIVGCDRTSMIWLNQNVDKLTTINPLVNVVNCDDKEDFFNLKSIAPKLRFIAINGSDIASVFNIHHYPVLITKRSISQ
jgi:integrating conjugative element protein (TIGR03765 family)